MYVLALARLLCQRQQQQGPGGTASLEVAPQEVTPADVVQLRREVLDLIHSKAAAAAGG